MNKNRFIYVLSLLLFVAIFILDLETELGVAGGVPYIAVVLLGLLVNNRKYFIVAGVSSIVFTFLGFYLSPPGGELWKVLLNRTYAVFAILITTFLCLRESKTKEQLVQAISETESQVQERTKELLESRDEHLKAKIDAEEANKSKSLFLANMSHEVRTPLNAILGYAQILLLDNNLSKESVKGLKTIDNSGKKLLTLINEILDISKIEAGKESFNPVDFDLLALIQVLSDLFRPQCNEKGLEWRVKGLSHSLFLFGDESKLHHVLVNLIGNAVKFTDSGKVEVSVKVLDEHKIFFEVMDTGNGIPREAQCSIFDVFQQGEEGIQKGGTGLGLAIARKHVEFLGGELKLESEMGQGTRFYFTLAFPVSKENLPVQGDKPRIARLAPGQSVTALVVDDILENREVLVSLLNSIGVRTVEADNGQMGINKLRECNPDIVFSDMRMPVMNGEEAIKFIRRDLGNDKVKIVAVTAGAINRSKEYYLNMGFDDFIAKPFRAEQIFDCLNEALDVEFIFRNEDGSGQQ